jgi:hypothetical protein
LEGLISGNNRSRQDRVFNFGDECAAFFGRLENGLPLRVVEKFCHAFSRASLSAYASRNTNLFSGFPSLSIGTQ